MNFEETLQKLLREDQDEEALALIESQLVIEPDNHELRARYALFLQEIPFDDYPEALKQLNKILAKDPKYFKAVLLKAFLEYRFRGGISGGTFDRMESLLSQGNIDQTERALLKMVQAFHFWFRDETKFEDTLNEVRHLDPDSSEVFKLLGKLQTSKGNVEKAKQLHEEALKRVELVYPPNYFLNSTSFEEFIAEKIRGTRLSSVNYETLEELAHN